MEVCTEKVQINFYLRLTILLFEQYIVYIKYKFYFILILAVQHNILINKVGIRHFMLG